MINCKDIASVYDSIEEYDAEIRKCEFILALWEYTLKSERDGSYTVPMDYDRTWRWLNRLKTERMEFIKEQEKRIENK